MRTYHYKYAGKKIQAVQWDGSEDQRKGINFMLRKLTTPSWGFALAPRNMAVLVRPDGSNGPSVAPGEWVVLRDGGSPVSKVNDVLFRERFEEVKNG